MNIDTVVSDVKQKEVVLKLLEETSGSTPKTLIPKLIENEEPNTLEIKNLNASSAYYVYAKEKWCWQRTIWRGCAERRCK